MQGSSSNSPRSLRKSQNSYQSEIASLANLMSQIVDVHSWIQEQTEEVQDANRRIVEICDEMLKHTEEWSLEEWRNYANLCLQSLSGLRANFEQLASLGIVQAQESLEDFPYYIKEVNELISIIDWRFEKEQEGLKRKKALEFERQREIELDEKNKRALQELMEMRKERHELQGRMRVFVKIRPIESMQEFTEEEKKAKTMVTWKSIFSINFLQKTPGHIGAKQRWVQHSVDHAFPLDITQEEVYGETSYLIQNAFNGQTCAILCSGQAASGKTYTMFGSQKSMGSPFLTEESGIVYRALEEIFVLLEQERQKGRYLNVSMSFREFYMGNVDKQSKQMFNVPPPKPKPVVKQDEPILLQCFKDAIYVLIERLKKRKVGRTKKNKVSSRSHFCICINVLQGVKRVEKGKISFIDLAGNEELSDQHPEQSIYINSSLTQLKICLRNIKSEVPQYWRGKLLVSSLRPHLENSTNILIATFSSSKDDQQQNKTSLEFATYISSQ